MDSPYSLIYRIAILISFDLNLFYAIRVISLLKHKLDLWNLQVYSTLDESGMHDDSKKMFEALANILRCYDVYKTCFQLYVSHL